MSAEALFLGSARAAGPRLALLLAALLTNALVADPRASLALAGAGAALAAVDGRRPRRALAVAGAGVVSASAVMLAGGDAGVAARVLAGAAWSAWSASALDWPSVRTTLGAVLSADVVQALDRGVLQGAVLAQEWGRRAASARVRTSRATLPVTVWGPVVAGGVARAVDRGAAAEDLQRLRTAAAGRGAGGVSLRGVSVRGDDGRALLTDLHLDLPPGSWTVLCGPSGAGKSTLLRLLAGLVAPSSGELGRLGLDLAPTTPLPQRLDGRVAWVPQNPDEQLLASTVREEVAFALPAGAPVDEALAAMGLAGLGHRPVHALSFGEQRRVTLAAALARRPSLLLLDEPTAGLDPVAADRVVAALTAAAAANPDLVVVWATHDLDHLPKPPRRAVLLRDGRVTDQGPVALLRSPEALVRAGLRSTTLESP
jgi:cobalt/nickel transport system ATP-binding protein